MIYELRRYELQQHNKLAFYERFEKQLMPILSRYGFNLIGAWDTVIGDVPETTYILAWSDLNTMQKAWSNLNSDKDWIKIKEETYKKPGPLVLKTHSQILKSTAYSPLQ